MVRLNISLDPCDKALHMSHPSYQNKKKKTRGKGKKAEVNRGDDGDEEERETAVPLLPKGGGGGGGAVVAGESSIVPANMSLYPAWKRTSSDSEFSDLEGSVQCKLRCSRSYRVITCFV